MVQVEADLQYLSDPVSSTLTKGLHLKVKNLGLKHPKKSSTVQREKHYGSNLRNTDRKITNISTHRLFEKYIFISGNEQNI